mgnify:CR=1 FL=1
MPMAKNNRANKSKYNSCSLECVGLSTCMELLLKLERERTLFRVLGTTRM